MGDVRLRHALRAELPAIADMWTEAFAHDPFLRWVQPVDAKWPAFGHDWMMFILGLTFERGHTYVTDPLDVAVAWIPPDVAFVGPDDVARGRAIFEEYSGAERADAALGTMMSARSHLLEESHWTLQYIGVRPTRQGSGLGAAAVAPLLRECDQAGLPCALISTNIKNVPFYERHGFQVAAEASTPDGAATLRPMVRAPSS